MSESNSQNSALHIISQRLRWQQCVVRASIEKEIPLSKDHADNEAAVQRAIDAARAFPSFEECFDDSDMHVRMRECGQEDFFYRMTGFKPRKLKHDDKQQQKQQRRRRGRKHNQNDEKKE